MNLRYRNVYSITKKGVERGHFQFPTRGAAERLAGAGRIGVEMICPYKKKITVVFYQRTR